MDVKDLKYFVAAYEAKSFSGATTTLGTVQSNVSLRIRNLEGFLGVALFVRLHRSVAPTTEGDLFYRHAKQVIATLDEATRAIRPTKAA
jgi:DNA-binding transcriptional LysR family regulator